MKINLPVTNTEREVKASQNILSTTDLKGAITYVNPDFIAISGFDEDELIGRNHNVVRHPDMPPAAFDSLWTNMKAGQPWMGMVKNRCKNGDHYWVDAFVMPIRENGTAVEYQSVRFKAERSWVQRAETIYKRLREGKGFSVSPWCRVGLVSKLVVANLLALLPAVVCVMAAFAADVAARRAARFGCFRRGRQRWSYAPLPSARDPGPRRLRSARDAACLYRT